MKMDKHANPRSVQYPQEMILQGNKATHEVIPICRNLTEIRDTYLQAYTKSQTHMQKYHHGVVHRVWKTPHVKTREDKWLKGIEWSS